MQNSLKKMLARMFADKKRQRRIVAVVCVLSVLVTTTVFTELMQPVITMTPDPVCGQAEHAHGADCFANQLACDVAESEEHTHGDGCYKNVLVCSKSEHVHTEKCYPETVEEKKVTVAEPTEVPPTEAPATEAPATEAPATEAPATEAPATEAPATEAPVIVIETEVTAEPTAEPTVEPTVEPTAEPTVEASEEPTTETTVEPTVEAIEEPTTETTVEPTVEVTEEPTILTTEEPAVEVTEEPAVEAIAPTVAVTDVSAGTVFVGQTVTWTIEAYGEAELTYYIADESGAEIASGTLDAGASYISWLADRAGVFTMTLTAANETNSVSAEGSVTVEASNALIAAVRSDAPSCFAGEQITFHFAYSGGVEPASVSITVDQDGEALAELSEFAETVTVIPANHGEKLTAVTAEITVTDSLGSTVTGICEIPCAVRTRENESDWEKSTRVDLTSEWPEDLIAVAETQLGYEESEIDFIVNDEGERQGYTRYGQWYGSSYAEWCAMFVSFDLNYAGIPEKYFPREANCEKWISALKTRGLYESAESGYEPEVGDLMFFDWEDDGESDHVGIITKVTDTKIETIEGNTGKGVRRCDYDRNDKVLYGYGCVLEAYENYLRDELDLDLETGVGAQAIVTAETANLRAEADADSELIAQLAADAVVDVLAAEQNRAEIWYRVSAGEQTGYIRSDLVETDSIAVEELLPVVDDSDVGLITLAAEPMEIKGLVPNEYYASTSSKSNNENYAVEASVVFVPVDSEGNELTDVKAPAAVRTMLNYTGKGLRKEFKDAAICPEVDRYVGAENVFSVSLRVTTDGIETEAPANYVSIFSNWNATPFTGCYFTYGETFGTCVNYLYNPNAYFVVRYIYNESQTYTATFVNGEAIVEERTLNMGDALGELPEAPAAEDGSIFLGWAATNADGEKVFATDETVISVDTAFEAVYAASATVEFVYLDPETNALTDLCEDRTVAVGTALTFPTQESFIENSYPEGASFAGWQILNGETFEAVAEPYTVTGNTVFYGLFQTPVTVTFQYFTEGDGIGGMTTVATYRTTASEATLRDIIAEAEGVEATAAQLPACPLTMDTRYFSHWATSDGTVVTLDTSITADATFEAVFADKAHIKFQYSYKDAESGAGVTSTACESYVIPGKPLSDSMIGLPVVEIPGRRFCGWILMDGGVQTEINLDTVVPEDATEMIFAAVLKDEISISFGYQDAMDSDNDGNTDEFISVETYTMLLNQQATEAQRVVVDQVGNKTIENLTRIPDAPILENYTFTGWYYTIGDTAAELTDLSALDSLSEDVTVVANYEKTIGCAVTFHDIDPDGNEKQPDMIIDTLVPAGEALEGYLSGVSLKDRTADEVFKWYTIDADGVMTEYDPTQPVTSDLELYTYTYRIVLTLADAGEAKQTASLLDALLPRAYAATVTVSGNKLTIEIAAGETLKASDLIVENEDGTYTDYSTYTYGSGSNRYPLSSLIGTTFTENTTYPIMEPSSATWNHTVNFYAFVDDKRVLVDSRMVTSYQYNNRYYISGALLESVYGDFGFERNDLTSSSREFPHTDAGGLYIWSDSSNAQILGSSYGYFSPIVNNTQNAADVYYLPGNITSYAGEAYTGLMKNFMFYSITVMDPLGTVYSEATLPDAVYVREGGSKSVTVENADGVTWQCRSLDGSETVTGVENADGTTTFSITKIDKPYVITTLVDGAVVILYDTALPETPIEEESTPLVEGKSEHTVVTLEATHTVLAPSLTSYQYQSGRYVGEATFLGWMIDGNDKNLITPEDKLDLTDTTTVELVAKWETKVGGEKSSSMVNFFVSLAGLPEGTTNWSGSTNKDNFTKSVYTADCGVTGQRVIDDRLYEVIVDSQYYVLGSTSGTNLNNMHDSLTSQLKAGFTKQANNGQNYTFKIDNFPTDEEVLKVVREMVDTGTTKITLNGKTLTSDDLVDENFTIKWYVFKVADDGWHIDGILVAKSATMIVRKTFAGDEKAINAVKSNFSITVAPAGNDNKIVHNGDTLKLSAGNYNKATNTYTWEVPVDLYYNYKVTENDYKYTYQNEYTTTAQYRVSNSRTTDQNTAGWKAYTDTGVTVTGRGNYEGDTNKLTVSFVNTYTAPGTLVIQKIDGVTGNRMSGVSFDIYKDGDSSFMMTNTVASHYSADSKDGALNTNRITTDYTGQAYLWIGGGSYTLQEVIPNGYDDPGTISVTLQGTAENNYKVIAIEKLKAANGDKFVDKPEDAENLTLIVKNYSRTVNLEVEKIWADGSARPVTVQLYRGGQPVGDRMSFSTQNGWTASFEDVPLYADGGAADYSIREESIASFYWSQDYDDGYKYYDVSYSGMIYLDSDGNVTTDMSKVAKIRLTVTNEMAHGELSINKVDSSNVPLAGATFALYEVPENELTTPNPSVKVTASHGQNSLVGVDQIGEPVTSDANGKVSFGQMDAGVYYLIEQSAPENYRGSNDLYRLEFDGIETIMTRWNADTGNWEAVANRQVSNTYIAADITVQKVDGSGNALSGATFQIRKDGHPYQYDGNSSTFPAYPSTTLRDLPAGTYTITETQAPTGYYGMSDAISFTITDGKVVFADTEGVIVDSATGDAQGNGWTYEASTSTFTVTNMPGVELPSTGGAGTLPYTIGGLLLMAASLLYGFGQRRKDERGDAV